MTAILEHLLAREVDATEARKLAGCLRFASLPTPATLADFDFDACRHTREAPRPDSSTVNEPRAAFDISDILLMWPSNW